MKKIKVLYIAGYGRSGSTLLDRMFGQLPGFFSTGEMRLIWERSFGEDQLCGCGASFRRCPFWGKVVNRSFGGFHAVDTKKIMADRHLVQRIRYLPQLIDPRLRTNQFNSDLNQYSYYLSKIYSEIAAESNSQIIIDSSKDPLYALVMRSIKNIDIYIIHLIRDSRAVAYSWQRKRNRPEITNKNVLMPRYSPLESSFRWNKANVLCMILKKNTRKQKYILVRYEDLVAKPVESINNIFEIFNINDRIHTVNKEYIVYLQSNHMVSGNPMRFSRGQIKIKDDNEWQEKMPLMQRLVVTLMTWPFLKKFDYI